MGGKTTGKDFSALRVVVAELVERLRVRRLVEIPPPVPARRRKPRRKAARYRN